MINTAQLDDVIRYTILDSLSDYAEGYDAGAAASDDPEARESFADYSHEVEVIRQLVEARGSVSNIDAVTICDALDASEALCVELNLPIAADEYATARRVLLDLNRRGF